MSVVRSHEARRTLSHVETVTFESQSMKVTVKARIDTGAKRTSIDERLAEALGIQANGRTVKVKCAGRDERQRRPLAKVPIRVGGQRFRIEASLAERGHLTYPVIVGRDVLAEGDFRVSVREAA